MEGGKRDLQSVKETATNANGELTQNKTNYVGRAKQRHPICTYNNNSLQLHDDYGDDDARHALQ